GKGQKEATVCVRLGGYGSEATGRAYFTDVCLEQVEDAPVGAFVLDLSTPAPQKETVQTGGGKDAVIPGLLAVAAAYLIAAFFVARTLLTGGHLDERRGFAALAAVLGAALLVRVGLSACVAGYGVDMGCFGAWASRMAAVGPSGFYEEGYFCDYPPAYMLVLGALGGIANLFGISFGTMGGEMLLKTVPIFCDILLAWAVFFAADRAAGRRPALGLAALIALNPATIITSACWGQIDSVLAVLLVAVLLLARQGRWQAAIPVFALTVLAKPQAGLLAPLGVAALVRDAVKEKETRKPIALGLLGGAAVTAVIVLPFSLNQASPLWIVDKYVETLSSYAYATLSTGNLMFLLGGNWTPNAQAVLGPITYGQLGMALMVLAFVFGVLVYLRGQGRSRLMLSSAATMQLVFVLGSKMHERYILPALALLMLSFVETGDARLLISAVLASAASAVNIGAVLAFEHLIAPNLWLGCVIGVVQLLAAGLTVWAAVSLSMDREPMRLRVRRARPAKEAHGDAADDAAFSASEMRMRRELLHAQDYRMHLGRRDAIIMLALTLVYGVVGFWGLGATKAPQGGYTSTAAGETVVIDLGERYEDFHIYYYGGVSNTAFSVAVSNDGVTYSEETGAFFDIGECYKWLAMRQPIYAADGTVSSVTGGMLLFSGRYIRLTFDGAACALWEVAAVDENGGVILPVSAAASGGVEGRMGDPNSLIDEQDTVPDKPSYYNSMYFDEIYHARTGYEHAHGQYTYETTHPPLGKVFMSWCIRLMGMTPFAWRFAGALCGVLMVPAMYLLARQLLGSSLWAGLCALLLSADCMHFTQTRIATIDSFPV
ncbi:MAG: glycosyltransferase family 39 protein, partial [Candidatus Ventricola sp.]